MRGPGLNEPGLIEHAEAVASGLILDPTEMIDGLRGWISLDLEDCIKSCDNVLVQRPADILGLFKPSQLFLALPDERLEGFCRQVPEPVEGDGVLNHGADERCGFGSVPLAVQN